MPCFYKIWYFILSKILQAYANAGAFIQEDLSEASVVFGVKQVPIDSLQRDKTFCFFSHTIKVCFNVALCIDPFK